MLRPPPSTSVSVEDLRTCGWKDAACSGGEPSYSSHRAGLYTAAAAAAQAGHPAKVKALFLLADACSLRLVPEMRNEPLRPTFEGPDHEVSLAKFSDTDIELLTDFCPDVDDALLRARLADILWLTRRPRRIHDAMTAIDAYRGVPLDGDSWLLHDNRNCWRRGISLALDIGATGKSQLAEMKSALQAAIEASLNTGNAAPSMIETMLEYGIAIDSLAAFSESLVKRAGLLRSTADTNRFFAARRYLSLAKRCFGAAKNDERCADMDCAISDTFAEEAAARIAGEHPNYVVAASFYADAVQALLAVPKRLRAARGWDKKLKALRQTQRDIASQSIGDFAPLHGEPVDIAEEIMSAQAEVADKDLTEALLAVAECWSLASRSRTEEATLQRMRQHFFSRLFASSKLSHDGRIVAKGPAAGDLTNATDDSKQAVWNKMVQDHQLTVQFAVQTSIVPSLRQFGREHFITGDDLINIAAQSGIVPAERVVLVAKGLKAGFEGDFIVALHLLVPQLEHIVRTHLQLKGAKTLTKEDDSLQMEAGLSTLVLLPEMEAVFSADLTFEIRALFCDRFGPNLRNELAHGLLHPGAMRSAESIYAWWLIFRMVYQHYWYSDEK